MNFKMSNNKFIAFPWTFHEHFMNVIHELSKEEPWIIYDHLAGVGRGRGVEGSHGILIEIDNLLLGEMQ